MNNNSKKTLEELDNLWEEFWDISINNKDEINVPFLHFPKWTCRFDIWHWFEEQNSEFCIWTKFN